MMKILTSFYFKAALIVLLIGVTPKLHAQFDPQILSQSTVKILIKNKRGIIGAATGFLWQKPDQVVTSLHVMSNEPGTRIIVGFGKKKRKATIAAVLPKADLVLLKINKPVAGWRPLTEFNPDKPKYKSEVSALGFNRGARGMATRELRKGFVSPEKLEVLLPPDALAQLSNSQIIDVKLPIYYLDGSLLPGYSGSPIVNAKGELIGIGDGGLESGAASVSWVIPANNLTALEQSTVKQTPPMLEAMRPAFSGETVALQGIGALMYAKLPKKQSISEPWWQWLITTANASNTVDDEDEENDWFDEDAWGSFKQVNYDKFEFIKVKSRSYHELFATSGSKEQMSHVFDLYNKFFKGYNINYNDFKFDIYEDGRYGLNIAVPQGIELLVDKNRYLLVKGELFCRTCPYEIQYHARTLNAKTQRQVKDTATKFLNKVANQHWHDLNEEGDFGEFRDFRSIESFGSDRYVLRSAYADFNEPFKQQFELNYFTAATNREAWFQAQGILNRFDKDFFTTLKQHRGTDCTRPNPQTAITQLCQDIETMMKILISVHLTSFSNKLYVQR